MSGAPSNRFLAGLSGPASELLLSRCTEVALPVRSVLYEPYVAPKYAYFPTSGLASVVTAMIDGGTAEVEIVGFEGLVGSFHLLGSASVPTSCFMQISGGGLRIPMDELRGLFKTSAEIRDRLLQLVQYQTLTIGQIAGCNRLHEAEARLARWLLMAQDRTGSDVLDLTQQFLAQMLGTQRSTVSTTAAVLQRSGFIRYSQGQVRITDREGLQSAACECYPIIQELHTKLYPTSANAG